MSRVVHLSLSGVANDIHNVLDLLAKTPDGKTPLSVILNVIPLCLSGQMSIPSSLIGRAPSTRDLAASVFVKVDKAGRKVEQHLSILGLRPCST